MSLIGKYSCGALGAILEISSANDSNGEGAGTFTINEVSYSVNVHYHFDNNVGPETVIQIWSSEVTGYDYAGAAGSTADTSGKAGIELAGGVSNVSSTTGFSGKFLKQ